MTSPRQTAAKYRSISKYCADEIMRPKMYSTVPALRLLQTLVETIINSYPNRVHHKAMLNCRDSKYDGGGTKAPPPGHFAFEMCELSAVACWQHYQGRNKLFVYMMDCTCRPMSAKRHGCGSRDDHPSV